MKDCGNKDYGMHENIAGNVRELMQTNPDSEILVFRNSIIVSNGESEKIYLVDALSETFVEAKTVETVKSISSQASTPQKTSRINIEERA